MKFSKQLANLSLKSFDDEVKKIANLAASKLIDAAAKGVFQTEIYIGSCNEEKNNALLENPKKFLKALEKELDGVKVSLKEKNVPVLVGTARRGYSLHFDWQGGKNGK